MAVVVADTIPGMSANGALVSVSENGVVPSIVPPITV
jgi:hypothetical protein